MTLAQIALLIGLAAVIGRFRRGRMLAMLAVSTAALFWLQPAEPFPTLAFLLPLGILGLTIVAWVITTEPGEQRWRDTWPATAVMLVAVLLVALVSASTLSFNSALVLPSSTVLAGALLGIAAAAAVVWQSTAKRPRILAGLAALIVVAFIIFKTPGAADSLVVWLRSARDSASRADPGAAFAALGFSYVAFRILHTIRDRQTGRLPAVGLGEYATYVIFFPAYVAGPIDRVERFVKDLQAPIQLHDADWLEVGRRLTLGLFKKFVLADLLAVISISDPLVQHVKGGGWMWLFMYAYAFRIYLDFSGYTDIAIGMARLLGVRLPENFDSPYLKQNIALFWNSWHMSLTRWFRSYVFNPLTRQLRGGRRSLPTWIAVLFSQVVTMLLIGLWHGITWSFAVWGLWHGLGLFVYNRWAEVSRTYWAARHPGAFTRRAAGILGTVTTFHFVSIGWLLFGLSSPAVAWQAFRLLVGAA